MADNKQLPTTGAGTADVVVATDEIAGVDYQRVKLVDGTLDSTAAIPGDATNGLDVDVTRSALPTGAATSALQGGGLPSALASDRLKVDGSGVTQPVSGTFWQATQPVSGTVTANAGTNLNTSALALDTTLAAQALVDNAGFTDGSSRVTPAGFIFDEAAGTSLTENDVAAARVNANRAQVGIIEDGATRGRWATVSASNALKVDGSAVTQPVSGTVTANAGSGTLATSLAAGPPPHNVGITALSVALSTSSQQTSANLIAGTGGQRIYVTSITVSVGGTTSGRVSIYWGTGAFSAGTSVTLFDGDFIPSATIAPGWSQSFTIPVGGASATGDNLRITTTAAMTIRVAGMAYKA